MFRIHRGSIDIGRTVYFILPVIIFGTIISVGVLDLKNTSLEPNVDKLETALDEFTTTTVSVGHDQSGEKVSEKDAEKQFRALVSFNALVAADCNLYAGFDKGATNGEEWVRFGGSFDKLYSQTDFEGTRFCLNALDLNKIDDWVGKNAPWIEDPRPANDMEGRYGKLTFEIKRQFEINAPGRENFKDEKFMMLNLKESNDFEYKDELDKNKEIPAFWKGDRISAFVPAGLSIDGESQIGQWELYAAPRNEGPGNSGLESIERLDWHPGKLIDGETREVAGLYNYRIRVRNAPIVVSNDFESKAEQEADLTATGDFESFVRNATYVFCEGAQGVIQSNAKYMDNEDEAAGTPTLKENAVFPIVVVTSGADNCIQDDVTEGRTVNKKFCSSWDHLGKTEEVGGLTYSCKLERKTTGFKRYQGDVNYYKPKAFYSRTECPDTSQDYKRIDDGEVRETEIEGETAESPPIKFKTSDFEVEEFEVEDAKLEYDSDGPGRMMIYVDGYEGKAGIINIKDGEIYLESGEASKQFDYEDNDRTVSFDVTLENGELRIKAPNGEEVSGKLELEESDHISFTVQDKGVIEDKNFMRLEIDGASINGRPKGCN